MKAPRGPVTGSANVQAISLIDLECNAEKGGASDFSRDRSDRIVNPVLTTLVLTFGQSLCDSRRRQLPTSRLLVATLGVAFQLRRAGLLANGHLGRHRFGVLH